MSHVSSMFGNLPGVGAITETFEQEITFGINAQMTWWNGWIDADAVDSGSSPNTYRLRPGLVLGQVTSTGRWTNYSPTATNGSEVASGILGYGMRMQDVLSGSNVQKFYAIVIGGRVKGARLLGLDLMARQQMSAKFIFDDGIAGYQGFPCKRFQTKTAAYTVVAADNFTLFDNVGATGAVTFTLPTLANGYLFGFRVQADQDITVASAAGDDMIVFNDASADSVAFSTASERIGGMFVVYPNPGATKWIVEQRSAGSAHTVTVAT